MKNSKIHSYLKHRSTMTHATEEPWTVPALCDRYKFPSGLTGGGVIGIIELGGGWDASDMASFFASISQPIPSITDVSVDGTKNVGASAGGDASYEVALDIQVAAAAYYCATGKAANVRVYWVQDMATGLRAAASDGCSVFSMSWGAAESDWTTGTGAGSCADMQAAALAALKIGMISFAASGDQGADDGTRKTSVDCPASCPAVVGCGGTTLTATSETVWDDNATNDATGGGYSSVFPVQAWQAGIPAAPSGLGRMVPDVASCADPNTGIEIFVLGSSTVVGGTSAAAPLWSGLVAACGVRLGTVNPVGDPMPVTSFYASPSAFSDIISGNNGVYSAGPGPDPCTGMGSPVGSSIVAAVTSGAVPTPNPVPTPPPPTPPDPTPMPPPTPPGSTPNPAAVEAAYAYLGRVLREPEAPYAALGKALQAYVSSVNAYVSEQGRPNQPSAPRPVEPPQRQPQRPDPVPSRPPEQHQPGRPGRGGR